MPRRWICIALALALCLGCAFGEELLDQYELVGKLSEDRYLVRRDGLWGIVDALGGAVLEPELKQEPEFEDGYAVSFHYGSESYEGISGEEAHPSLWGAINSRGEICIPFEYDRVEISSGVALVQLGEEYRYLELDGTPLNGESYDRALPFEGDYATVGKKYELDRHYSLPSDALWGAINRQGEQVIPFEYDLLALSEGGPAKAGKLADAQSVRYLYGYVDLSGKVVIDLQYDGAETFVDGYAAVCKRIDSGKDGSDSESELARWGVIDARGNEVLPLEYDSVTVHEGGRIEAWERDATRWFAVEGGRAVEIEAPQ